MKNAKPIWIFKPVIHLLSFIYTLLSLYFWTRLNLEIPWLNPWSTRVCTASFPCSSASSICFRSNGLNFWRRKALISMFPGGFPIPNKYQQNKKLESLKPNRTKTKSLPMLRRGKVLRPSKCPITLLTLQQIQKYKHQFLDQTTHLRRSRGTHTHTYPLWLPWPPFGWSLKTPFGKAISS